MLSKEVVFDRMNDKLVRLYGSERAPQILTELKALLEKYPRQEAVGFPLSEKDVVLITYGDIVQSPNEPPLVTLHKLFVETLQDVVRNVHILPFYPYSSDDGFSVIDYQSVNPDLGDWTHIEAFSTDFNLMFDAVFNHISAHSEWFQKYLQGDPEYSNYFVEMDPSVDLSEVVRPRALPLLTKFQTASGEKHVWTTFSDDQIDLNAANPDVVLDLTRILLLYIEKGAKLIRLDAIAFLWKIPGTSCIHLEETHLIIQLWRDILSLVAPAVLLVTETNVPHKENISYFGDGTNEAQMVYQFPLPPLILHTLSKGNTTALSQWASTLKPVGDQTAFFNFTASHDGIGVRPVTGILTPQEIDDLIQLTKTHGGNVSYKNNSDGTQSPYELNITYFDAITQPVVTESDPALAVKRFMISQAIVLAFAGVPGIYFHSIFGSRNYYAGVNQTGRFRSINREKVNIEILRNKLQDEHSVSAMVYGGFLKLLRIRMQQSAFHPLAAQRIHHINSSIFCLERVSLSGEERIITVNNVTDHQVAISLSESGDWCDLISNRIFRSDNSQLELVLEPFQTLWLKLQ